MSAAGTQQCRIEINTLGIREIQETTPHRHPFLLADCIEELGPGMRAVGYKCVTFNELFLTGHFPGEPVMPGILIIEALAQVGGVVMLSVEAYKEGIGYFGTINNAKFRQMVRPGDKFHLECGIIRQKGSVGIGKAIVTVDGRLAASAELTFMIGQGIEADV